MDKNISEILEQLSIRTISFFDENLSLKIDDKFKLEKFESIGFLDITTLISLSNAISGTVAMSVSKNLSKKMAKGFLYGETTQDEIDSLCIASVTEILNITIGNIIENLTITKNCGVIDISTPNFFTKNKIITKEKYSTIIVSRLKINNEEILLSYFI